MPPRPDRDKDWGKYPGYVVDNADPQGRHRVTVSVPNKIQESAWASPVTTGGAVPNSGADATFGSGFSSVPRKGALVLLSFLYGDVERPVYEGGGWGLLNGKSTAPADIAAAGPEAHLVHAGEWRFADVSLRVKIDERPGKRSLIAYAVDLKNGEEPIAAVELDLERRGVVVYGLTGVAVQSDGFVQITAPVLQLNERPVLTRGAPV